MTTFSWSVSATGSRAAARSRHAGGLSRTSELSATTWRINTTVHQRWWWRNIRSPAAGWRPWDPSTTTSNPPQSVTWFITKARRISVTLIRRPAPSAPVIASAIWRPTASTGATSSAAAEATTRGLRKERRSATVFSTGVATLAVRSAFESTTCTPANKNTRFSSRQNLKKKTSIGRRTVNLPDLSRDSSGRCSDLFALWFKKKSQSLP